MDTIISCANIYWYIDLAFTCSFNDYSNDICIYSKNYSVITSCGQINIFHCNHFRLNRKMVEKDASWDTCLVHIVILILRIPFYTVTENVLYKIRTKMSLGKIIRVPERIDWKNTSLQLNSFIVSYFDMFLSAWSNIKSNYLRWTKCQAVYCISLLL